jgi:hypothetical protein
MLLEEWNLDEAKEAWLEEGQEKGRERASLPFPGSAMPSRPLCRRRSAGAGLAAYHSNGL